MKNITKVKKILSFVLTLCITLSLFVTSHVFAATYDTSKYDKNDVEIINAMIKNNRFYEDIDDPENWVYVTWNESTPKRVVAIEAPYGTLRGAVVVSGLSALTDIRFTEQYMTSLDASGCTSLKTLLCDINKLKTINVSGCTSLEVLRCDYNELTTLDITGCTALKVLDCSRNYMVSKSSISGLSKAPQYMHLEFMPQVVDVLLPKPSTSLGDAKLSLFAQNESPTLSSSTLVKNDGSMWMWYYDVPHFTNDSEDLDQAVKLLDGVVAVSSGFTHDCAIKKDGSLWAWGGPGAPPLGDKKGDPSETPLKIMDGVASVSTGSSYTMAIKKDGSLWGWGLNNSGQLGDGTLTTRITPVKIMDGVVSVSAAKGDYRFREMIQTMVIKKDGSLWGWGANDLIGKVDTSGATNTKTPIKIMENVASVSSGYMYTMAIKKDGSLWAWGLNNDGQLGVKTTRTEENYFDDFRIKPIKIMDNVVFVSTGGKHAVAIKTDGSLWGWGNNEYAQLGDDLPIATGNLPSKIMNDVASVVAAQGEFTDITMVLKPDGTVIGLGNKTTGAIKVTDGVMLPKITSAAPTTPTPTTPTLTATPTASKVLVNGTSISFDAYTIKGNNYFKLRDLAKVLSGSEKQFEVTWDGGKNAIGLISGKSYTISGGELASGDGKTKTPTLSTAKIYVDGEAVTLVAYTINGSNYFKLRDVMQKFNVGVGWDKTTSTITIDSTLGYTP